MKKSDGIILKMWRELRIYILLSTIFALIGEILKNLFEVSKGQLVDIAISGVRDTLANSLIRFGLIMIAIPLTFYLFTLFFQKFQVYSLKFLRKGVFNGIFKHTYPDYLKESEGYYTNAYVNQIDTLEFSYFYSLFGLLQIVASVISALYFLFRMSTVMGFFSITGIILAVYLPKIFESRVVEYEADAIKSSEKNITKLNEFLDGVQTIVNFGRVESFMKKFEYTTADYKAKRNKWFNIMSLSFKLTQAILVMYNVACILVSASLLSEGSMSIGDYAAALGIMNNVLMNVPYTTYYLQQLKSSGESFKYIEKIMVYENLNYISGTKNIANVENISFESVSFKYPEGEREIIKDFNIYIDKKGITLIEGESGSGKTTLINLFLGYYKLTEGIIKINGVNFEDVNLDDLIAVMRQESMFFDASLKDNLTMFGDLDDAVIIEKMNELGLEQYANKETLHDIVGEYSGGEARRMMILRAVLSDKPIIVFDEPLAGLDDGSILCVENMLSGMDDRFVIVISHQNLKIPYNMRVKLG